MKTVRGLDCTIQRGPLTEVGPPGGVDDQAAPTAVQIGSPDTSGPLLYRVDFTGRGARVVHGEHRGHRHARTVAVRRRPPRTRVAVVGLVADDGGAVTAIHRRAHDPTTAVRVRHRPEDGTATGELDMFTFKDR